MNSLNLSPLPSIRLDQTAGSSFMERDGFVDDLAIRSLLLGPTTPRPQGGWSDIALAADDMDFAGWCLTSGLPAHATSPPRRQPDPPVLSEEGIGQPHCGAHRWWLAGLAGAFSTMLISLLLIWLSARNTQVTEEISIIRITEKQKALPDDGGKNPQKAPELTDTSRTMWHPVRN